MRKDISSWISKIMLQPQCEAHYPLDWNNITGKSKIICEIGFGNGVFLDLLAAKNTDSLIIGFDISMESCLRGVRAAMNHNHENIRIIKYDAKIMLRELFPADSIDAIYMNFPDPWPKKKHKKNRTLSPDFINILAMVLKPSGFYELVTDQKWYWEEAQDLFSDSSAFSIDICEVNPLREIQTKYEKKWIELKRDIHRIRVSKKESASVKRLFSGDSNMPHVKIQKELTVEEILNILGEREYMASDGSRVKILECFVHPDGKRLMIKTLAIDPDLRQQFMILINRQKEGWIVKLDDTTQPFRTPAVKFAVFEMGRRLEKSKEESGEK